MSSFWQQMPFVRILLAFTLGIVWEEFCNNAWQVYATWTMFMILIIGLNHKFSKTITSPITHGIAYFSLFICLGACCLSIEKTKQKLSHFSNQTYTAILVQTIQKPQKTNYGWKAEAVVIAYYKNSTLAMPCKGKVLLFVQQKTQLPLKYGTQFIIKSGIQEIVSNNNPGSFNFKTFMQRKGIYHQCFLKENAALVFNKDQGMEILQRIFSFQDYIHQTLQKNLIERNEIAMAEALLYGYDKDIDEEISDAFSKTGTLHVLAVSGMHVGLIFMLLGWLLKPILTLPRGKIWVASLQVFGIWMYALICGLPPSILRACVMFSFVILGKQLKRSSNPFNSLSAAGFLLLTTQPYMLYNVGFQLSFAAVAGILGFYPYLNLMFQFKHTMMNEIWKIIAISLAAQTLTLPISIYYFHQFPNYFLLANLMIIPLSTVIIYGGIILLILSPIQYLASGIGFLLGKLISFTSWLTMILAKLPYATIDSIIWSMPFILSYYFIGVSLIYYFSTRNIFYIKCILWILSILSITSLIQTYQQSSIHNLCIYASKQNLLIQVHHSHLLQIWQRVPKPSESKENLIQAYLMAHPNLKQKWNLIDTNNYTLKLNSNQELVIIQGGSLDLKLNKSILLLTGKKSINLKKILLHSRPLKVILHSDIPRYRKKAYLEILQKNKIPLHDITENGAFELSL